jgi:hypothetical protein
VTRVGITGHQRLLAEQKFGAPAAWAWIADGFRRELAEVEPPLVGLTSLAAGADQVFAECVLEQGGDLQVVLPFANYAALLAGDDRARFEALVKRAQVECLLAADPIDEALRSDAFFLASQTIVNRSDRVFAVWERNTGNTTDRVIKYAYATRRPLTIFDPLRREVGAFASR